MKQFKILSRLIAFSFPLFFLFSCLSGDQAEDYSGWRQENDNYLAKAETETIDGLPVYEKISPEWDKSVYVLMRWHNNREETQNELSPLSNSTVALKYTLTNIEGDILDKNGAFTCLPNSMITGFWTAVTNMHPGDTVTAVIPYNAGYGAYGSGAVLPYSTLVFGIRLDSIVSYIKK